MLYWPMASSVGFSEYYGMRNGAITTTSITTPTYFQGVYNVAGTCISTSTAASYATMSGSVLDLSSASSANSQFTVALWYSGGSTAGSFIIWTSTPSTAMRLYQSAPAVLAFSPGSGATNMTVACNFTNVFTYIGFTVSGSLSTGWTVKLFCGDKFVTGMTYTMAPVTSTQVLYGSE